MTDPQTSYHQYRVDHAAFQDSSLAGGPSWLRDLRVGALDSFNSLGFPTATRGNERWKYTNVGPLAKTVFDYPFQVPADGVSARTLKQRVPWDDTWQRLAFVDGRFSPALSLLPPATNGAGMANLADAVSNGAPTQRYLGQYASAAEDGFTAVNTAFLHDGAFVRVPDGASPAAPLHILFMTTKRGRPHVTHPRALVLAGRNSSLTVVETYVGLYPSSYFTNSVVEIVAEDGAQIDHYRYMVESPDAFHIGNTYVSLARDSSFNSTSFSTGCRLARNELHVLLDGPGARCTLNGLYMTSGTQHVDNHIDIDHARPHTTSDQYFKGVLADRSRAVFSGRVLVRKDAQKTVARQSDKNLLLSEGARVNTKPSLEIFADDVQCTHGATAGAVAEDALFYMRSRGLDEDTARILLVHGFAREVIERVELKPVRDQLDRVFTKAITASSRRGA